MLATVVLALLAAPVQLPPGGAMSIGVPVVGFDGRLYDERDRPRGPNGASVPTAWTEDWHARFEDGTLSEWTWWARNDGCSSSVVDADAAGIPPLEGSRVARFETTDACLAQGRPHSKVFKEWARSGPETGWRDDAGRPLDRLPGDSPAGAYRASFYFPAGYRKDLGDPWTNLFQFKEAYLDDQGVWRQDPQWWVNVSAAGKWGASGGEPADPRAPVLHINHWSQDYARYRPRVHAVPLGRWFELGADVLPGRRIDWYLDGKLIERSSQGRYPVGFSRPRPVGWTFGVGHYDGVGEVFADRVGFASGSPETRRP